jgi:hypothetical protein
VDGSYGVRALDADRNARLMSITDKATWIIEGVYYRWLRPSFERADMIFVVTSQRRYARLAYPEAIR